MSRQKNATHGGEFFTHGPILFCPSFHSEFVFPVKREPLYIVGFFNETGEDGSLTVGDGVA